MMLSTTVADELAAQLAHTHHVEVGDKKYALTPIQTRGIPHGYIPGVHKLLDDYVEAVDRVAHEQGREGLNTVNGLFSLPYSAFTQVMSPPFRYTLSVRCALLSNMFHRSVCRRCVPTSRAPRIVPCDTAFASHRK